MTSEAAGQGGDATREESSLLPTSDPVVINPALRRGEERRGEEEEEA